MGVLTFSSLCFGNMHMCSALSPSVTQEFSGRRVLFNFHRYEWEVIKSALFISTDTQITDFMTKLAAHDALPLPEQEGNELRAPEANTTLSSLMSADERERAIRGISRSRSFIITPFSSSSSIQAKIEPGFLTDTCAKVLLPSSPDHSTGLPSSPLLSNTSNEWPEYTTVYVSDSDIGSSGSSFYSPSSSSSEFFEDHETSQIRVPANNNLSTTPLPFRESFHDGSAASAFSVPSQFSNRAKVGSARAKKSPPTPIDILKANERTATSLVVRPSPSSDSNKGKQKEDKEDPEKSSKSKGRDRSCKFTAEPSPSTSPTEEEAENKSDDLKGKFIIGLSICLSPTEEVAKNLGWFWRRMLIGLVR